MWRWERQCASGRVWGVDTSRGSCKGSAAGLRRLLSESLFGYLMHMVPPASYDIMMLLCFIFFSVTFNCFRQGNACSFGPLLGRLSSNVFIKLEIRQAVKTYCHEQAEQLWFWKDIISSALLVLVVLKFFFFQILEMFWLYLTLINILICFFSLQTRFFTIMYFVFVGTFN